MTIYRQLTLEDRIRIGELRLQGFSVARIAESLDRHRSTIYRELQRNCCHVTDGAYRPSKAERRTRARRSRSRRNSHFTEDDFKLVRACLRRKWSPEQISGALKVSGELSISHERIYQYVWCDKWLGGHLWTHLRQSTKLRRKRYRSYDSRGRLAGKRHISERPKSVEGRRYRGHWEIDTVMGKGSSDCIVTLVERKTGYLMIGKLKDRTTRSLNKKTRRLIRREPTAFKTITADNGTEFHQYRAIEAGRKVRFYFANPYHSWERGSNENANGLIRQYLPKGTSMEDLTQQQCDAVAYKINTRPRKRFNFKTPEQVHHGK